jgi:hypothetical protein
MQAKCPRCSALVVVTAAGDVALSALSPEGQMPRLTQRGY